ncbi:unnamed protein product [Clonostachys rosea]|uniref:Mitochondrial division protein 1 n=1 Tax=Bionectria ochroleuca TaxID=29856 RepID=A0ABY6UBH4_BIOOC|nr:unnamed protein product [Clonostachys rosea]
MEASTTFELAVPQETLVYGFALTEKYMVAAAQSIHIRDFLGHKTSAKRVSFLTGASLFASGSSDGEIIFWKKEKVEPSKILRGDKTVRIWDIASAQCIRVLEGHANYISILTFSLDGTTLYAGSGADGHVRIWDWRNGTIIADGQTEARHKLLYQNMDDGRFLTGGFDGVVRLWSQNGAFLGRFTAHPEPMRGLLLVGRFLVTVGTKGGEVKVWDWESKTWLFDIQGSIGFISNMATGHGKLAIASWENGRRDSHCMQLWDLDQLGQAVSKLLVDEE